VPFDQFEKHVEPLLRRQLRVELIVGAIRILKTAKDLNGSIHPPDCSMSGAPAERGRPISFFRTTTEAERPLVHTQLVCGHGYPDVNGRAKIRAATNVMITLVSGVPRRGPSRHHDRTRAPSTSARRVPARWARCVCDSA
jgi:hypothetical protein